MHRIRDKRRKRRKQSTRDRQHFMQRRERRAIVRVFHVVKARARKPHIPLGHIIVHELHHATRGNRRVKIVHVRINLCFHAREPRQDPPIKR